MIGPEGLDGIGAGTVGEELAGLIPFLTSRR